MVAPGLTFCVPPAPGSEYVLPSDPLIDTFVAFAAETDKVDDAPVVIVAGAAEMATVGVVLGLLLWTTPHPTARSADASIPFLNESN